ncbi:MAG: electron transfer flavoprotein subunit alpha/FixB family protein, partial [Deltaproteobacteria bacterium]|nr:electron transfer flavoprotein subunit alpha/FixB family protein [Deltaproteobacteria bacterium]
AEKAGGAVHLVVLGPGAQKAAQALAGYGAAKIHVSEDAALAHPLCEAYCAAVVAAAKAAGASTVAAVSSSLTKDFLPRVAARLDAAMASDVMAVVDAGTFKRPMWAGNAIATVELATANKVCSVRGTEFAPPSATGGNTPVESLAVSLDAAAFKGKFVSLKAVKSERPDLAVADRVVSGGRGVKGPEGFKLIEQLADALGAAVGASRAVCDAGWVPNDLQVGQTGKVVAPDLYMAVGISGAIQHLAGMKGSKVIVAINKDPEAPIFQVADYGLVADLFTAVPEIIAQLKK